MYANPVHRAECPPEIAWSTINASEAVPGVVTPLTWSFFGDTTDRAMKWTFYDMGVLSRDQVFTGPTCEMRLWDVFHGRAAGNLSTFRYMGDRTPGTSGEAIEEQIFGQVREGVTSKQVYSRYPAVAVRMPWSAYRMTPRLKEATGGIRPWWENTVAPGALSSEPVAKAALRDAHERFEAVMRPHTLAAMLSQAFYDQLHQIAETAGKPGLELDLATGYGNMAETDVVTDMWAVSRDRLSMDEFIHRHGFHGPAEGELSSFSWRQRRAPVEALVRSYRDMADDRDPRKVEAQRGLDRRRAEAELFGALPRHRRGPAKVVLGLAARFIPQRGVGKAAFLQCVDAARESARVIGADWAGKGLLEDAEHVFMFTLDELTAAAPPADAKELAAARLADRAEYERHDIPDFFEGVPKPYELRPPDEERADGAVVTGTPVSAGEVDGVARLVLDPNDAEFEPGEILVCRTTDPGWASTMMLASALVIDIGGPISHGAIVARELGIPCVIGTRDGTQLIRTGDRLRVDGAKGEVKVL